MRKTIILLTSLATLASPVIPRVEAAAVYRQGEGWSSDAEDSGPIEETASAQLRKAEDLENRGETLKALGAYKALVREFPSSGAAPRAQIKIGDLSDAAGDSEKAFKAYGTYLSRYPRGDDFERAVESQFKIANEFLDGKRRKVFGVKTFPSMERAEKMFEEIIKNAPFSKWAALSQFNIGRAREKQGKIDEAVLAYQEVVDRYPMDEIAADAQYQIGYLYFAQAKAGSNDQAARQKAREAFEDFIMRYPKSEKVAQANENLEQLSGTDLKKTLGVAQYYERVKNYKAAAIYYEEVVQADTASAEAEIARKRLDHLGATVGEDALRTGPEKEETASRARQRRKLQAQVDVASRPDFAGPPAPKAPPKPDEVAPARPQFRMPATLEPPLPNEPAPADSGLEAPPPLAPALPQ